MTFQTQIQAELLNLQTQYADLTVPRRGIVLTEIQRRQQALGSAGSATPGATEATLQQVLTALNNVAIDADTVNLNTDELEVLLQAVRDRLPTTLLSGNLRVTDTDAVNLLNTVIGQLGTVTSQLTTVERLLKPPLAGKGFVFSLDVNPQTVYGHDDNRRKTWVFNNSPESTVYFSYDGQFNPPDRVNLMEVLAPLERKELLSPASELVFVAEDPTGQPPQGILNVVEFF